MKSILIPGFQQLLDDLDDLSLDTPEAPEVNYTLVYTIQSIKPPITATSLPGGRGGGTPMMGVIVVLLGVKICGLVLLRVLNLK